MAVAAATLALVAGPALAIGSPVGAAPTGAASYQMAGVSCASATFCMAVGSSALRANGVDNASKTLVERWNGTKWTIVTSPNAAGGIGTALRGVSCFSKSFCMAVGSAGTKTFVTRWNGTKWAIVASPNPAAIQNAGLNSVSCTSATNCFAVGSFFTPDGRTPTLVERWNGTKWSIVASPNPVVGQGSILAGVACTSATNCLAVGRNDLDFSQPATLIERWNGAKWTIDKSPNRPHGFNALNGVSCASSTNCTAVGWSQSVPARFQFGPPRTLVERWNGTKWTIVASTNPGTTNSVLNAVSCKTTTSCAAVGLSTKASDRSSAFNTLAERWNGTKWSTAASPNPVGATSSHLAAVSCVSTTNCAAVGHFTTSTDPGASDAGPFNTLFEKWNGTKWSLVASPKPPAR